MAQLVEHVKTETSRWAKDRNPTVAWQTGYAVFSVSQSNLNRVIEYVDRQDEHHRGRSFQDEFRELCQKHSVHIDERYAWD